MVMIVVASCLVLGDPVGRDVSVPTDPAFATTWGKSKFSHALWDGALQDHVNEAGLVRYDRIGADRSFREYLYRIANTNPKDLAGDGERLAFWINAYNAVVIQGVLETLPAGRNKQDTYTVISVAVPGIQEPGKGFFAGLRFMVGGKRYTLDEIEKSVLLHQGDRYQANRAAYDALGPKTPDPRIHFALVCGAKGCPKLQLQAYRGEAIDAQLDNAVREFVETRVSFDRQARLVAVSELLNWYGDDLTNGRYQPHAPSVIAFLAPYVTDESLARSLRDERWGTRFTKYDWTLNQQ